MKILNKITTEFNKGKTFIIYSVLNIFGRAIAMISQLVIAYFLAPDIFGKFSISKMILFLFTSLLITSSKNPFIIFANQEKVEHGKINKTFSVQLIFLSFAIILFIIIFFGFNKFILIFTRITFNDLFFLCLAYLGLVLKTFFNSLFLALDKKVTNALTEFVFGSLLIISIFILYFIGKLSISTIFLSYFISSLFTLIIFIFCIDFKQLFPFKFDKKIFFEELHFVIWQMFGLSAVYLINWGDNFVLRFFVSMEDIGVYNFGYQIFKGIFALITVINTYFLPFISKNINDKQKIKEYLAAKRIKILFIGMFLSILLFFLVPIMTKFIYKDSYTKGILVFKILLIIIPIRIYYFFYVPILNTLKKYKFIQIVDIVQVILNISLNILFVYIFGFIGAAIATLLTFILTAILYEVNFNIRIKPILFGDKKNF